MTSKKHKLLVVAPSFLDELGHPIYIDQISSNLSKDFDVYILCQDYKGTKINQNSNKYRLIKRNFFFLGLGGDLDTKILLEKIPFIKNLFYGLFKLFFWLKIHNYINKIDYDHLIYLEFEPLSYLFASKKSKHSDKKHIATFHSIDFEIHHGIKGIYKRLTKLILRNISSHFNYFAVHSISAKKRLTNIGIEENKIFISGWGFEDIANETKELITPGKIKCLSFGVMMERKRLTQLVDLFLKENDDRISLEIIGKNIDLNLDKMLKKIRDSKSKTSISVENRFVPNIEINKVFSNFDVAILSHNSSFSTHSGILFNAIENNKPILCFSYNDTKDMVDHHGLGVAADLDNLHGKTLFQLLNDAIAIKKKSRDSVDYFLWDNIAKRIKSRLLNP